MHEIEHLPRPIDGRAQRTGRLLRGILRARRLDGGGFALRLGDAGFRGLLVAMPPVHEIDDGKDDDDRDDSHAR